MTIFMSKQQTKKVSNFACFLQYPSYIIAKASSSLVV